MGKDAQRLALDAIDYKQGPSASDQESPKPKKRCARRRGPKAVAFHSVALFFVGMGESRDFGWTDGFEKGQLTSLAGLAISAKLGTAIVNNEGRRTEKVV